MARKLAVSIEKIQSIINDMDPAQYPSMFSFCVKVADECGNVSHATIAKYIKENKLTLPNNYQFAPGKPGGERKSRQPKELTDCDNDRHVLDELIDIYLECGVIVTSPRDLFMSSLHSDDKNKNIRRAHIVLRKRLNLPQISRSQWEDLTGQRIEVTNGA